MKKFKTFFKKSLLVFLESTSNQIFLLKFNLLKKKFIFYESASPAYLLIFKNKKLNKKIKICKKYLNKNIDEKHITEIIIAYYFKAYYI